MSAPLITVSAILETATGSDACYDLCGTNTNIESWLESLRQVLYAKQWLDTNGEDQGEETLTIKITRV